MVRRDEPLVTLPGSGPCNGYHRVQRIVHVHGDDPTPPWHASDGWLYFTDPGSGLEGRDESPLRELDFNGIYRLSPDGQLELLYRDQARPNSIALSPDETTLYVANSSAGEAEVLASLNHPNIAAPRCVSHPKRDSPTRGA